MYLTCSPAVAEKKGYQEKKKALFVGHPQTVFDDGHPLIGRQWFANGIAKFSSPSWYVACTRPAQEWIKMSTLVRGSTSTTTTDYSDTTTAIRR